VKKAYAQHGVRVRVSVNPNVKKAYALHGVRAWVHGWEYECEYSYEGGRARAREGGGDRAREQERNKPMRSLMELCCS
jgi:hypothetical protein